MNREKLIAAGVDYDEGAARFGGQTALFAKYLEKFFAESLMETLERQLAAGDTAAAFRTAHDLKGAAGNLSLNAYYDRLCALTELLRAGAAESDCAALFSQTKKLYDAAEQAAREESR